MQMSVLLVGVGFPHANVHKARCKIGVYRRDIGIGKMQALFVGVGLPRANVCKARCKIGGCRFEIGVGE